MKEEMYRILYAELEEYESSGIRMKLNNMPASPLQIVNAHMVQEESTYMRDYVWDDKGRVQELTFHNILENNATQGYPLIDKKKKKCRNS